jgi:hypothetical protein
MLVVSSKRSSLWLLVGLLICSTLALAFEAKRSQYHSASTPSYLSQAVKMREGPAPQYDAPQPLSIIPVPTLDVTEVLIEIPSDAALPQLQPFLDSFQFRPPPPSPVCI